VRRGPEKENFEAMGCEIWPPTGSGDLSRSGSVPTKVTLLFIIKDAGSGIVQMRSICIF
jgi:hypothetical protein